MRITGRPLPPVSQYHSLVPGSSATASCAGACCGMGTGVHTGDSGVLSVAVIVMGIRLSGSCSGFLAQFILYAHMALVPRQVTGSSPVMTWWGVGCDITEAGAGVVAESGLLLLNHNGLPLNGLQAPVCRADDGLR